MQLTHHLAAGLIPAMIASARALSRRVVYCVFDDIPAPGTTCGEFAAVGGFSVDDLKKLNPGIVCPSLDATKSYFVIGTATEGPTSSSTTSTAMSTTSKTTQTPTTTSTTTIPSAITSSTTSITSSAATPSNIPGLATDCDGFYKVKSGDQCDTIAQKHGISTDQFKKWNTYINDGACPLSLVTEGLPDPIH